MSLGRQEEGIKNVMNICFKHEEKVFEMEVRLFEEGGEDRLQFSITDQAFLQKYYETTFTSKNIPSDFITIYETLAELYEHIATSYDEALELYLEEDGKENAVLFISVLIIKKIKKFRLVIEGKPLTELMKEEHNLKKLVHTIEEKRRGFERVVLKETDTNKKVGLSEREIERLKGEEKELMDRVAMQVEVSQAQSDKNKEIMGKIAEKQREISLKYQELIKEGFEFTEEEVSQFLLALQYAPDRKNGKRMIVDKSGISFPKVKEESGMNSAEARRRTGPENDEANCNGQANGEVQIVQSKFSKCIEKDKNKQTTNMQSQQKQRRIKISDSNQAYNRYPFSSTDKQKTQKDFKNKQKSLQSNNNSLSFIHSSQNQKATQEKPPIPERPHYVTVLSSQSEEQANDNNKEVGVRITLDFSQSQNMDKYKMQTIKTKTYIERTNDDKNFYHLYHRYPIRDKQNMQISIYTVNKNDFSFGIMSKEALQVSRLTWTKECICWLGATKQICSQLKCVKIDHKFQTSDLITVSVDCPNQTVYFYHNRKFVHREKVPEKMINDCYFFVETATKGNKIYFM